MSRRSGFVLAAILLTAAAARAQSQPGLRGYAVLAFDAVRIGPGVRIQPGSVGVMNGIARLARRADVRGSVVADTVRVARHVRVGRLFCGLVSGSGFGGVAGGPVVGGSPLPSCRGVEKPLVDVALIASVPVTPGTSDLRIAPRSGGAPVGPGAYGVVSVGRGAVLQLAGGDYQLRSMRIAPAGRVVCLEACRIGVAEHVRLAPRAQLGAAAGRLGADQVRIDVGGTDIAFRSGWGAIVAGTVSAPAGDVVVGPAGEYRGAFVGRTVTVGRRSRISEASAFPAPGDN